jgi:hypothetical protein
MAWEYTQNFDGLTTAVLNGQDSWTISGAGTWDPVVETSVVLEGTKSVGMTPDNGSDRGAQRLFTAITDGIATFKIRKTSASNGRLYVQIDNNADLVILVDFNVSGNILLNGNTIGTYVANTTYTIDVWLDCSTDKTKIRIDGGSWSSEYSFYTAVANVSRIRFTCADSTTNSVYFDAIGPASDVSGPANLKSYNTNLKANIKSINTNVIANVKSLDTNV